MFARKKMLASFAVLTALVLFLSVIYWAIGFTTLESIIKSIIVGGCMAALIIPISMLIDKKRKK